MGVTSHVTCSHIAFVRSVHFYGFRTRPESGPSKSVDPLVAVVERRDLHLLMRMIDVITDS